MASSISAGKPGKAVSTDRRWARASAIRSDAAGSGAPAVGSAAATDAPSRCPSSHPRTRALIVERSIWVRGPAATGSRGQPSPSASMGTARPTFTRSMTTEVWKRRTLLFSKKKRRVKSS